MQGKAFFPIAAELEKNIEFEEIGTRRPAPLLVHKLKKKVTNEQKRKRKKKHTKGADNNKENSVESQD